MALRAEISGLKRKLKPHMSASIKASVFTFFDFYLEKDNTVLRGYSF